MQSELRPLRRRQEDDLRGYVSWGPQVFRATVFVGVVGFVGWLLRSIQARVTSPGSPYAHAAWWVVPVVVLAAALYRVSRRWTGGRAFRARVRSDLARGMAAAHRVVISDAIEITEGRDEGPTYFVLTDDGKTMFFTGQYMDRLRRKGFPWKAFAILEAPDSKVLFDVVAEGEGERLTPSMRRGPLTWQDVKKYGILRAKYGDLDVDFESLKRSLATSE